jgi:hypothetical protein
MSHVVTDPAATRPTAMTERVIHVLPLDRTPMRFSVTFVEADGSVAAGVAAWAVESPVAAAPRGTESAGCGLSAAGCGDCTDSGTAMRVPHWLQNRASSALGAPQEWQYIKIEWHQG